MDLGLDERELSQEMHRRLMQNMSTESMNSSNSSGINNVQSQEYLQFKKQYMEKNLNFYEKACNYAEKTLKIKVDEKDKPKLIEAIETCHLNVTPEGTASLALLAPIAIFFATIIFSFVVFGLFVQDFDAVLFFSVFGMFLGLMAYNPIKKMPYNFANRWRMKASNQMVICVFYTVTYMRHTSNLENAIKFASDHIDYPLSLDLKKVLWNVETQKYESIRESLEYYLKNWKEYAPEFVESMHMIESSLMEGQEERRLNSLDKSLDNILEETYEKMLHYAHNLNSPLTTLNMLGVVLPILGLVILPLMVSLMDVDWYYLAAVYNVLLFAAVYYLGSQILASRPTGYGDSQNAATNPAFNKFRKPNLDLGLIKMPVEPKQAGITVAIIFLIIALLPIFVYQINPNFDRDATFFLLSSFPQLENLIPEGEDIPILGYREMQDSPGIMIGPFGLPASILSYGYPLALGLGLGLYYKLSSNNVIKIREQAKKLENEFAGALFQLGNRLGDGLPTEIAFERVADILEGSISGQFFRTASQNIRKMGMGIEDAIFDKHVGAVNQFPSDLIRSTMKVLIEASKKGPLIAAQAMNNVSTYIKEIHKVDERLKDLLGETIASMKSQVKMLSPTISAIVVGVTSMIITILGKLGQQSREIAEGAAGQTGGMVTLFGDGIPTYFFQIVVGIYVVQVVFILTKIANGIENGDDKLSERFNLGQNLIRSTLIYVGLSAAIVTAFTLLAENILNLV